jgi:hypothetical protein
MYSKGKLPPRVFDSSLLEIKCRQIFFVAVLCCKMFLSLAHAHMKALLFEGLLGVIVLDDRHI